MINTEYYQEILPLHDQDMNHKRQNERDFGIFSGSNRAWMAKVYKTEYLWIQKDSYI